jgi:undecaprenol kinase
MNGKKFSLKSRIGSFIFAFRGLLSLLKNEHNARIHFVAAIASITLGIILKISTSEWTLLIIIIGLVFISELFNSSIETLADHVNPAWNKQIGTAKDYAAAAVLISAIIALIVGGFIFIPKISGLL